MKNSRAGFSLFEIVIVIGITAVIVVAVGKFSNTISGLGVVINSSLQADQDLGLALTPLITDIRSMGPSGAGAYAIEAAGTSSLAFYSDVDQDGVFERVRYHVATSTFERGVIEPSGEPLAYPTSSEVVSLVIPNVRMGTSSVFEYFGATYNGAGTPLAQPVALSDVRVVRITLTADVATSTAPKPITYTNTVTIRNLRSN